MTFARPINDPSPRVTQAFGSAHRGTDYGYNQGTPVYASADGTVTIATNHYVNAWRSTPPLTTRDYGNLVKIDHGAGWSTLYAHLQKDSLVVSVGQRVRKGQLIARVGNTGNSTGAHLHWEIRKHEIVQDPAPILDTSFTAYGDAPVGGEGTMVQLEAEKFEELVAKSTAYDELKPRYEQMRAEFDHYNQEKDTTIRNLNEALKAQEGEIKTLRAEQKTLEAQLGEAIKQREIFEIDALKIPELTADLNEALESRQRYIDENVRLEQTIERERREHATLVKQLEDDALSALIRKIMRVVRGGEH